MDELILCNNDNTSIFTLTDKKCFGKIIDIYDGDSVTISLPLISILTNNYENKTEYYSFKCRLAGIDTPEKRTKNDKEKFWSKEAIKYLENILNEDRIVYLHLHEFDKYGRLLVTIYNACNSVISINNLLVSSGYAYKYSGKTKKKFIDWFNPKKIN